MPEYVCKLIPQDPDLRISRLRMLAARSWLRTNVQSDEMICRLSEMPKFVDCGGNLEKIRCPICGAEVPMDWWQEAMDTAEKNSFRELHVTIPCCGKETDLNGLLYEFPCGFSCVELDILNPQMPLEPQIFVKLEKNLERYFGELTVIYERGETPCLKMK